MGSYKNAGGIKGKIVRGSDDRIYTVVDSERRENRTPQSVCDFYNARNSRWKLPDVVGDDDISENWLPKQTGNIIIT